MVDTVNFNGRTPITQSLGQWKSDALHLVERFTRVDHDHLVIDMTYYDSKAWGDKAWPGFHKYYHEVPIEQVHDRILIGPNPWVPPNPVLQPFAVM